MNRDDVMDKARAAICWYRKHRDWMNLADRSLRALYYARDGNPARMIAAGASIGADVINKAFPETSIDEDLRQRGYHLLDTPIGGLLCDILSQNGTPSVILEKGHKETAKLWEQKKVGAAAVYYNDEYHAGPYILGGDERYLLDAVMRQVWSKGTDLMLTTNPDTNIRKGSKRFALVPIPDPGPYIGEPGPAYYAGRLGLYGNRPRTMLLKGPSGIGKSVLARHIASLCSSGSARTLKIAGNAIGSFGSAELRDLARFLQPSVMLLDDLNIIDNEDGRRRYGSERMLDMLLDVLEALRVEGCLVIATMMVPTDRGQDLYRGDNYVEGMRPGRIDEIVTMFAPEDKDRSDILEHYYGLFGVEHPGSDVHKKIVKMTDGLTGAYLREVAERIHVHGYENLASEIEAVLQASPPPPVKPVKPRRGRIRRVRKKPKTSKDIEKEAKRIERKAASLRRMAKKADEQAEKRHAAAEKKAQKEAEQKAKKKEKAKTKKAAPKKRPKKKAAPKKKVAKPKAEPPATSSDLQIVNPSGTNGTDLLAALDAVDDAKKPEGPRFVRRATFVARKRR
jgi:hypothetical protein